MRLRIGEQEYDYIDAQQLTLKEARQVKGLTGLTYTQFYNALTVDDPDALAAMIWLIRRRRGERDVTIDDVDFSYADFHVIRDDEPEDEGEADPTATPGGEGESASPPSSDG